MLRVELAVVLYVPGDEDNEEDVNAAYSWEDKVGDTLSDAFENFATNPRVYVDYVGTMSVEQDDETYKDNPL